MLEEENPPPEFVCSCCSKKKKTACLQRIAINEKLIIYESAKVNFGQKPFDPEQPTPAVPVTALAPSRGDTCADLCRGAETSEESEPRSCISAVHGELGGLPAERSWGELNTAAVSSALSPPRQTNSQSCHPPLSSPRDSAAHRWLPHMFGLHTRWFLGYCGC